MQRRTTVVNDSSLKKEVETFAEMPSRSDCVAILEDAILITAASSLGRNSPLSLVLNNAKNTTPLNSQSPVTINSGGVVFFALFNAKESGEFLPKEEAAVIKIASSRMATQSERLSCEFAKWLGVRNNLALVGKTQGYGKPFDRVVVDARLEEILVVKVVMEAVEESEISKIGISTQHHICIQGCRHLHLLLLLLLLHGCCR
ncbi:hypothetical protein Tco_1162592 [Tanacetum coccineum]